MCTRPTTFVRVQNPEGPGSILTFQPATGPSGGALMPASKRWLRVPVGWQFEGGEPPSGWYEINRGLTPYLDDGAPFGSAQQLEVDGQPVYCRLLSSTPPEPQALEVYGKIEAEAASVPF